jgi:purine-nucleoside phosphorylase
MSTCALDVAVDRAIEDLARREVAEPQALFYLGTGGAALATRVQHLERVPLARVPGVPEAWHEATLFHGLLGQLPVWLVDDAPGAAEQGGHERPGEPPWACAFPVWLASAAGAAVCVHTSAGVALPGKGGPRVAPGSLALVRDHVNLSGRTPLLALGDSELGPLFPDVSQMHHAGLRAAALRRARELGLTASEAVAACVAGPALETAAERAYWARAGADVAVQELQNPLLACAHAGFAVLAVVCVTDAGEGASDVRGIVQRAETLAPALEDLVAGLASEIAVVAGEAGADDE